MLGLVKEAGGSNDPGSPYWILLDLADGSTVLAVIFDIFGRREVALVLIVIVSMGGLQIIQIGVVVVLFEA